MMVVVERTEVVAVAGLKLDSRSRPSFGERALLLRRTCWLLVNRLLLIHACLAMRDPPLGVTGAPPYPEMPAEVQ